MLSLHIVEGAEPALVELDAHLTAQVLAERLVAFRLLATKLEIAVGGNDIGISQCLQDMDESHRIASATQPNKDERVLGLQQIVVGQKLLYAI